MDELISFDMIPDGVERYTVKNLKINPNLEYFKNTLKYNGKKYRIEVKFGYIAFYRPILFWDDEFLFFLESESNYHESRIEFVKELLNLSKDKMQRCIDVQKEFRDRIKDWNNRAEVKSFRI